MVTKVLTDIGRIMDEHSENFNKKIENIKRVLNRSHKLEEYSH